MMTKNIFILIGITLLLSTSCSSPTEHTTIPEPSQNPIGEFIDNWTFNVYPPSHEAFDYAAFKLWVPSDVHNVRAILVLLSYTDGSTLGEMNLEEWKTFATNEKLALVGVDLKGADRYSKVEHGSGNALIKAIDTIAFKNNISFVSELPMLLNGFSAGAAFCSSFSYYKPERVVAFVSIRGGSGMDSNENIHVPGLVLLADNDIPARNQNLIKEVLQKRKEGAVHSYAMEPNTNHLGSLDDSWILARSFFSVALNKRLIVGSNELQHIPENTGWLGDNNTNTIYSFSSYPNAKEIASWLINESFAKEWKIYQQ